MNIIRMVLTRLNLKPMFSGFNCEELNAAHRMALAVIPDDDISLDV
jgi:hypothetical protein